MTDFDFTELVGADPVPWLLGSDEPYAVWATLTGVLARPPGDPDVNAAHSNLLHNETVRRLVDDLPAWDSGEGTTGHHSPGFPPNRLNLLADMGVGAGDFERVEELLDGMLEQQDARGRFHAAGPDGGRRKPETGSLLCDTNVVVDVLLRFGRGGERGVRRALGRMVADLAATPQGRAWQCVPEQHAFFRMPGRGADMCPQVTLEGLRAFSHLPHDERPSGIAEAARTPLEIWRRRTDERPYGFGHGYQFKSVKWPNFWYDVLWALETVGRYPEVWRGPRARSEDRRSVAELAACLIAYNFDGDGTVTPRRVCRGFEDFSFGRKQQPSPFATARCLVALSRVTDLAEEIASVDVEALPSSQSGRSAALPPRRKEVPPCPVPTTVPVFPSLRAVTRILARHHLGALWEPASIETVVGDIVGAQFMTPTTPYLALAARFGGMTPERLDSALYERRSLSRIRCMRGMVYLVRTDMLPVVFAATNRPVVNYARTYATFRGVSGTALDNAREAILGALADGPLTTAAIRERVDLDLDVAAAVNLMCAEGILLRDRPVFDWHDRRATYIPFADALPDIRLDSVRQDDADVTLTRAHVRAFGPVLFEDAAWWTGLGRKRTRRALDTLGDEIMSVVLLGTEGEFLMHAADVDELASVGAPPSPSIAMLPCLDSLLMGYRRRGRFIDDAYRPFVFDTAGRASSVVLVDGRVAGVWDAVAEPEPRVVVHVFGETPAAWLSAIIESATKTGRFIYSADVRVTFVPSMSPLTRRPAGAVFKPLR
ncbi:MAG: AlkZ family DNA glycosylase [Coriobacteriia bacterium]|nr:AlkZ family DNA glycosylase [Coriobacteriia bacterium]